MVAYDPMTKVICIVGPTASGKTALSIAIAQATGGEIVSADSRQVYKGLDIGTGKITRAEQKGVPHHLLDVADPKDVFAASDFVRLGRHAIDEIVTRGKIPIIVGGTGFYIDALLGTISLPQVPPNEALRKELEALNLEELVERLKQLDSFRAETVDVNNRPRVVRAIEIAEALGSVPPPNPNPLYETVYIGLTVPLEELRERIHTRLLQRFENGMLEEAKTLNTSGLSYERMETLGLEYRYMARHLQGLLSYEEMVEQLEKEIVAYAKRQLTWFKRNKNIHWLLPDEKEKAIELVVNFK